MDNFLDKIVGSNTTSSIRIGNRNLSILEFSHLISVRRDYLSSLVKKREKVGLFTGRGHEYWADWIALFQIGAVPIPLQSGTSDQVLEQIASISGMKKVVRESNKLHTVNEWQKFADVPIDEDIACILFTSGSTGAPKGVLVTYKGFVGNCESTAGAVGLEPGDNLFVPVPFNFTSAISHFFVAMYSGATYSSEESISMPDLVPKIKFHRANALGGAPVHLFWLSKFMAKKEVNLDWLMSSGDHLSPGVINELLEIQPDLRLNVVYGLTEVSGRLCISNGQSIHSDRDSVGKPIDGLEVEVRSESGELVSANEPGEVFARGSWLFKGYLTQDGFLPHNEGEWFSTKDSGTYSQNGGLIVLGRCDDVFKTSGKKISAMMIADTLQSMNCFTDVAVVGDKDKLLGHVPHIYYVTDKGMTVEKKEIVGFLRQHLNEYQVPYRTTQVEKIPRTPSGKLKRAEIQEIC